MPKKVFRAVYALNFMMQAVVSMLCPAGLLILGGWYLTERCGVGKWAMAVAIVLGVLFGFYSMIYYIVKYASAVDPTRKEAPHDTKK